MIEGEVIYLSFTRKKKCRLLKLNQCQCPCHPVLQLCHRTRSWVDPTWMRHRSGLTVREVRWDQENAAAVEVEGQEGGKKGKATMC
jgi:hypothetical protein